ncbi:UNVERIFIED_CONTAM: hypothetical protein FKN15_032917 [Acipenser sinensis]
MVGGNRKSAILVGARSCQYTKRLKCNQLRAKQRWVRPGRQADCKEELGSTKGTQVRRGVKRRPELEPGSQRVPDTPSHYTAQRKGAPPAVHRHSHQEHSFVHGGLVVTGVL